MAINYFLDEKYDKTDKYSIEKYGQKMVGKTFQELIDMDTDNMLVREPEVEYVDRLHLSGQKNEELA